jgi:hypothetical protein
MIKDIIVNVAKDGTAVAGFYTVAKPNRWL